MEENLRLHTTGAEIFAPFVIVRLVAGSGAVSAKLYVLITDARGEEQNRRIHLIWTPPSAAAKPFAVQERVKTEWGA